MQNLKNGSLVVLVVVQQSSVETEWVLVSADNASCRLPLLFGVVYIQCETGRLENSLQRKFSSAYFFIYTSNFF